MSITSFAPNYRWPWLAVVYLILSLMPAMAAEPNSLNPTPVPATNSVSVTNEISADIEKEYREVISKDDDAQSDVDGWIQDNNRAKIKGNAMSDDDLNRKILQRFEPVKKAYEEFIQKHPNHPKARLAYGGFLIDSSDETGAQTQWEKALELDPTNSAVYNNLAGRYAESGHEEKAFGYYTKAIQLKPDESLYHENFADALYICRTNAMSYYKLDEQGVIAKALGFYSNAFRLDPAKFLFASKLADTYYSVKPFPANMALNAWTNALKLARTDLEQQGVHAHLARVNILDGRYADARAQLNSVTNRAYSGIKSDMLLQIEERTKAPVAPKQPASSPRATPETDHR